MYTFELHKHALFAKSWTLHTNFNQGEKKAYCYNKEKWFVSIHTVNAMKWEEKKVFDNLSIKLWKYLRITLFNWNDQRRRLKLSRLKLYHFVTNYLKFFLLQCISRSYLSDFLSLPFNWRFKEKANEKGKHRWNFFLQGKN